MSFSQAINYNAGAGFTYDAAKVEFVGGKAKLKLVADPGEVFSQAFTSDAGFTYDSTKAEFAGGLLRQKSLSPSGLIFAALYGTVGVVDAEFAVGSATGTAVGTPVVSAGKMTLNSGTEYVDYAASGNVQGQAGCIRLRFAPIGSGAPATTGTLFSTGPTSAGPNMLQLIWAAGSGALVLRAVNSSGAEIFNGVLDNWLPTAAQFYEIELNYDFTAGATRLFIDGVQVGATQTGTGTFAAAGVIRVGSLTDSPSTVAHGDYDWFICFNAVQHTAGYSPAGEPTVGYAETIATLPTFTYSGPGALQAFTDFAATVVGGARFIVNGKYWDGDSWETSDNTYAQASAAETIDTNFATLAAAATLVVKVVFQASVSVQSSVDVLTATYTGQIYPTDNPSIANSAAIRADALYDFDAVITEAGADAVKFLLTIDGTPKRWNGTAWVTTTSTYANANTVDELADNVDTLDISGGESVLLTAFLHSTDGTTTPDLTSATIDYDFYPDEVAAPNECVIYTTVRDILGEDVDGVVLRITPTEQFFHGEQLILPTPTEAESDAEGVIQVSVVETETVSKVCKFEIEYQEGSRTKKITLGNAEVPDDPTANLSSLTFVDD